MSKSKKLFILLSLAIAVIDIVFVTTNYFYARTTLEKTLRNESDNDYAIYQTVLESTYNGLSIQATFFAGDNRIQQLFLQGKKALAHEGGDAGGVKTAIIRNKLYKLVEKSWHAATKQFDMRQLHFHLGPGALSFLRVHQPNKFGDHLDDLRFLIVDTNAKQSPRWGFETGRVSSGLRSAVPIFAYDPQLQKKVYVGALEVGTSYKKLLETIEQNINIKISVLLNRQHIEDTVWGEFITGQYNNNTIDGCDCILEASSDTEQKAFLEYISTNSNTNQQLINADGQVRTIEYNKHFYAITFYPFRDYLGIKIPARKNIGSIFIARNIDTIIHLYNKKQWVNILYSIIAYFVVELLLVFTFFNVTKHLTRQVIIQTTKLSNQKNIIEQDKLKYKNLADAINSSYFFYTRDKNNQLSHVSPSITHVLGFSPENFLTHIDKYLPKYVASQFLSSIRQPTEQNIHKNFELDIYNKSGRLKQLLVTESAKYKDNSIIKIEGFAQDISRTRQESMLLELRCHILQLISDKHSEEEIFITLTMGIEAIIKDIHCAIMIVDQQSKHLSIGAAPHLPIEFIDVLENIDLMSTNDFDNTSCAIAISTAKRKIITDLQLYSSSTSSEILQQTFYKASCSEPVLSKKAQAIASIDFYYQQTGTPTQSDLQLIAAAADLVSILLN